MLPERKYCVGVPTILKLIIQLASARGQRGPPENGAGASQVGKYRYNL